MVLAAVHERRRIAQLLGGIAQLLDRPLEKRFDYLTVPIRKKSKSRSNNSLFQLQSARAKKRIPGFRCRELFLNQVGSVLAVHYAFATIEVLFQGDSIKVNAS